MHARANGLELWSSAPNPTPSRKRNKTRFIALRQHDTNHPARKYKYVSYRAFGWDLRIFK
jgi:hypothetical protein